MCANRLIDSLPRRDRARLLALCETVELDAAHVLSEDNARTLHVYFPLDGFISLIVAVEHHPGIEVGMVGREGMLGWQVGTGTLREPLKAVVVGMGSSLRVAVRPFVAEMARGTALRRAVASYVQVLMAQRATLAGCLRHHLIGPRLARWLLMGEDRASDPRLGVTQAVLARSLGVRRVGVTEAAGELQRRGLIAYHRGMVTVIDRSGLEGAACACYERDRRAYERLLPPAAPRANDRTRGA